MILVAEPDVPAASAVLAGLGFTPLGEVGIPLRWAFKEPSRLARTNTYVVAEGSLSLRNHFAVRDILRADSDLRERYAAVKRQVGATAANIDDYGRGKNAMVQQILAAAGLTEAERASMEPIKCGHTKTFPGSNTSHRLPHLPRSVFDPPIRPSVGADRDHPGKGDDSLRRPEQNVGTGPDEANGRRYACPAVLGFPGTPRARISAFLGGRCNGQTR